MSLEIKWHKRGFFFFFFKNKKEDVKPRDYWNGNIKNFVHQKKNIYKKNFEQ